MLTCRSISKIEGVSTYHAACEGIIIDRHTSPSPLFHNLSLAPRSPAPTLLQPLQASCRSKPSVPPASFSYPTCASLIFSPVSCLPRSPPLATLSPIPNLHESNPFQGRNPNSYRTHLHRYLGRSRIHLRGGRSLFPRRLQMQFRIRRLQQLRRHFLLENPLQLVREWLLEYVHV